MTPEGVDATWGAQVQAAMPPAAATTFHQAMREEALIKRFFERWTADPEFRDALRAEPAAALAEVDNALEPSDLAQLFDPAAPPMAMYAWEPMRRMWRIVEAKARWTRSFYLEQAVPTSARVRAWRERQMLRQVHDLGPFHAVSNIHSSLCVELTSGCSVGCWFCALSPDSLNGVYPFTPETERFFAGMLEVLDERLGPALGSGFLYWATDPFDNPDYEQFCLAFHQATGVFPPTTTARHLVDPERTRRLVALAEAHGCWLNRFSVLSRPQMARTHRTFTAQELALVECLPLNPEAGFAYGNAGRFRERALQRPELLQTQREKIATAPWHSGDKRYQETEDYANGTIGCVTGLLINLVRNTIQLISPCTADDRWPLGYIIFGQERYRGIDEFAAAIDRLYGGLRLEVRGGDRLQFAAPLRFAATPTGFCLTGRFQTVEPVHHAEDPEAAARFGAEIAEGGVTVDELCQQGPLPEAAARELVADLFHRGLLAEEAFA